MKRNNELELTAASIDRLVHSSKPHAIVPKQFVYSRPFNINRWSDHPDLQNCFNELVVELDPPRNRKREPRNAGRFRAAVRAITLDLYVAWKEDPNLQIGISRGKYAFEGSSRYRALFLTYDTFIQAFNSLRDNGYLAIDKEGYHDPVTGSGKVTRIRATKKLITRFHFSVPLTLPWISTNLEENPQETIRLNKKDEKKKKLLVEYEDTAETRRMRFNLTAINNQLNHTWIDLHISNEEMVQLKAKLAGRYEAGDAMASFIDFTARTLHRVFNNESWNDGGRFYGGWWQNVPKECRQFITIDAKATVEVDYSGMHIVMLYAEVGLQIEGDPHALDMPGVSRDMVKSAFLKMINAEQGQRIDPPEGLDAPNKKLLWKELQEKIMVKHRPIAKYLRSGHGLKLQRTDADIAESVMLHFLKSRYTCLPVHDSFIVHHGLAEELETIMKAAFFERIERKVALKKRDALLDVGVVKHSGANKGSIQAQPISNVLTFEDSEYPYSGYENRLLEWRLYTDRREHPHK
jgi:hypothetical protein